MNWVYWCSCNKTRAHLIDSLSSAIDVSFAQFQEQVPECFHVTAVKELVKGVDAVHCFHPERDFSGMCLCLDCLVVCTLVELKPRYEQSQLICKGMIVYYRYCIVWQFVLIVFVPWLIAHAATVSYL